MFVFYGSPKTIDKYIIQGSSSAIHARLYPSFCKQSAVPATLDKDFWEQVVLLKPSYKVPSCLEACVSILAHYVHTGKKLYPYRPQTWIRTSEKVEQHERRVLVGRFDPVGLYVKTIRSECIAHEYYGLAGVQTL